MCQIFYLDCKRNFNSKTKCGKHFIVFIVHCTRVCTKLDLKKTKNDIYIFSMWFSILRKKKKSLTPVILIWLIRNTEIIVFSFNLVIKSIKKKKITSYIFCCCYICKPLNVKFTHQSFGTGALFVKNILWNEFRVFMQTTISQKHTMFTVCHGG